MQRVAVVAILAAVALAACDARPQAPEFVETTTTSTTLPGGSASTTSITLPPPEERIFGTVDGVTDGDTLDVTVAGVDLTVRLLGINAPEMTECWGDEARAALARMVDGQQVQLVAGDEDVDSFGRALRFLYVGEGDDPTFVNAALVEEGNAVALQNGNPFASALKETEARAFQSGRGMWGTFACGESDTAEDRPVIRVEEIAFDPEGPDDDAMGEEYVTIVNEGYDVVAIGGWVLRDESSTNRLTFPAGTTLAVGDSVTVVTGCDGGPPDAIHWCSDTPVWSNDGDTVIVHDTVGNVVVWYTYTGEAP